MSLTTCQGKTTGSAALGTLAVNAQHDPTLFCAAHKKHRVYLFTRREPDTGVDGDQSRDVFNERPTKDEQASIPAHKQRSNKLARRAVLHTTQGDIHVRLYGEDTPKTVEVRAAWCHSVLFLAHTRDRTSRCTPKMAITTASSSTA